MTRSISPSMAPIVADLELEQPLLVSMDDMTKLVERHNVRTPAKVVAARLREHGWLLPTATAGVWEFAPGAHAGPLGHGDPLVELKAVIAANPAFQVAVAGSSALAIHRLIDRSPDRVHVAVPPRARVPVPLTKTADVSRFVARLTHMQLRDVPVQRVATVLVFAATKPGEVRSWAAIGERLDDIVAAVDPAELDEELRRRPAAVRARLAYLVHGVDPELAERLCPAPAPGKEMPIIWFGPREGSRPLKASRRFGIRDRFLPFRPSELSRSADSNDAVTAASSTVPTTT